MNRKSKNTIKESAARAAKAHVPLSARAEPNTMGTGPMRTTPPNPFFISVGAEGASGDCPLGQGERQEEETDKDQQDCQNQ